MSCRRSARASRASRRQFLGQAAAGAAAAFGLPTIIPASALGREGRAAPSERIVMGSIGVGGMGTANVHAFLDEPDVEVVALCDVDARHLKAALETHRDKTGKQGCRAFADFRELLARPEIDAVVVATPDHWHALASVAAAEAKKDIYCEKPLANSIGEGRAIVEAVKRHGRVLQTGSHERSGDNARRACELVRSGRIGQLRTIRINLPCDDEHHKQVLALADVPPEMPVPEGFDYDFWLGHTAKVPYTEKRCHFWWRFILAYGGGEMTDRGAHVIDIGQLGGGFDDTGPVELEATGSRSTKSLYDAFMDYRFENTYANGVKLIGQSSGPRGVRFEGSEGWIFVHIHGGDLEAEPKSLLSATVGPNEVQLGRSPGHRRNFLDCVKSRQAPVAAAEIGHRTASVCHLNNIALRLGRKLRWDPQAERFLGDDEANALILPKMRAPWRLVG